MGQKVNPISLRLGYITGWQSNWVASKKDFAKNLKEDYAIRQYLTKNFPKSIIAKSIIERTLKNITLTIYSSKSGILIGSKGAKITKLTQDLKKACNKDIQINVVEVRKPELDAHLVGSSIAAKLRDRIAYKKVIQQAISTTMRSDAKGIMIWVAGRLGGSEIARTEKYKENQIPLHTIRADIDYSSEEASTVYGKIGVKVWIFRKEVYGKRDLSLNIAQLTKKSSAPKPRRTFIKK